MAFARNRKIIGRTRLQKIFCLLELAGEGAGFEFSYRHYGPYCEKLSEDVRGVCAFGLAKETTGRAAWGGTYSIYEMQEAADGSSSPSGLQSELVKFCTRAEVDAVDLELAVTAAWLKSNGEERAWEKVRELKFDKADYIDDAQELYRKLREIAPQLPEIPA